MGASGEWLGEVRIITVVDTAEHPRDDVELRDPSSWTVERIGEHRVDFIGDRWHQKAVAMKCCGIGSGGTTAPELPVQEPEPWIHKVGPMHVPVHGFPAVDGSVNGLAEAVMDELGNPLWSLFVRCVLVSASVPSELFRSDHHVWDRDSGKRRASAGEHTCPGISVMTSARCRRPSIHSNKSSTRGLGTSTMTFESRVPVQESPCAH